MCHPTQDGLHRPRQPITAPLQTMRPLRSPLESLRNLGRLAGQLRPATPSHVDVTRPLDFERDRVVLLHYEDFERDAMLPGDRYVRRGARKVYHAVTKGTTVSGFEVAYRMLVQALELAGCTVVSSRRIAARNPRYPVGVCGYTHALDTWTQPNPIFLGPGMYDHPAQAPRLFDDVRVFSYLVPCPWMQRLFEDAYGRDCPIWFGGLDTNAWPDLSPQVKDLDFVVYDKIRWERAHWTSELLSPVEAMLTSRGLRYETIRYGAYDIATYRAQLARAKGMLFLCEHETQGFAYQEAMSSNVPILAWDQGTWLDPVNMPKGAAPVAASSVPYFSEQCGLTFRSASDFGDVLDRFISARAHYQPRRFVESHLSFAESARRYLEVYAPVARAASRST